MKRFRLLIIGFLISLTALAQVEKVIPNAPNPPRLVNDFANLLTPEQRQALEQKLGAYDDTTSTQIAIVTVTSLEGYSAEDYAIGLGKKWGVGGKDYNNGIVILVSTGGGTGNRDAFIAVGRGLEGRITDLTSQVILDDHLIPRLKEGNYYRGFDDATDVIIQAAYGQFKATKKSARRQRGIGTGIFIAMIIIFFLLGRGGGKRGGGMISRRGYGDFWTGWIIGNMLGGGGRSGGFGGGGGWGGGGGGFGGFGGGGFGGGGAGGKW